MSSPLITPRYGEALRWAVDLHGDQIRLGTTVPFLSHVIAVSCLVLEDGGNEDQAIAGLLHDAIEDAGQSRESIAHRYGSAVAEIVEHCTDPGKHATDHQLATWFHWKSLYLASLSHKPEASLLVTAADKAHNAEHHLLEARRDPGYWQRCNAGLEASVWYFQRLNQELGGLLPGSRSVQRLGQAVEGITRLPEFFRLLSPETDPMEWARAYERRLNETMADPAQGSQGPGVASGR